MFLFKAEMKLKLSVLSYLLPHSGKGKKERKERYQIILPEGKQSIIVSWPFLDYT